MKIKHYETTLQIYDKTLIISKDNNMENENIAQFYDHHGIEICRPLQFENSHKGLKNLRDWIYLIITKQTVSRQAS
ncbi:MAG: hypothetical protein FH756_07840 [Firmicutes bacterium]|nr:hypothetical protein [Bacillota bacterium]